MAIGVVFDGFSTLFSAPNIKGTLDDIAIRLMRQFPGAPITKRLLDRAINHYAEAFDCGLTNSYDRWLSILQDVGVDADALAEAGHLVDWCVIQEAVGVLRYIEPLPGVRALLNGMRQGGIPTAICTTASPVAVFLERQLLGLDRQVDVFVASCELGQSKSSDDFLLEPSRRLGIPPQQLLFVDDGLKHLENCKRLGYITVQVLWAEAADNTDGAVMAALNGAGKLPYVDYVAETVQDLLPILHLAANQPRSARD